MDNEESTWGRCTTCNGSGVIGINRLGGTVYCALCINGETVIVDDTCDDPWPYPCGSCHHPLYQHTPILDAEDDCECLGGVLGQARRGVCPCTKWTPP